MSSRESRSRPVLAADTAVVLDGEIFGKPRDRAHALGGRLLEAIGYPTSKRRRRS